MQEAIVTILTVIKIGSGGHGNDGNIDGGAGGGDRCSDVEEHDNDAGSYNG